MFPIIYKAGHLSQHNTYKSYFLLELDQVFREVHLSSSTDCTLICVLFREGSMDAIQFSAYFTEFSSHTKKHNISIGCNKADNVTVGQSQVHMNSIIQ